MSEHLPDVDQLPKELDVLQLMRQKGYGPEVDEILELRSQNGKLHAWLALVRRDLAKREEFIESEFFQRVTYKQQAWAALDKQSAVRAKLEEALAQWECPDVRGAIQEAIAIIDGQGTASTTGASQ